MSIKSTIQEHNLIKFILIDISDTDRENDFTEGFKNLARY